MTEFIEKTIEIDAPVQRVWSALTDPAQFGAWFRVRIDTPFVVGEAARGQILVPGYEHVPWEVRIVAMEAPRLFAFTWHPYAVEDGVDYSAETPTRVEFKLAATATGARLTVVESGFENVPEHRRAEAFRMNEGGWAAQVKNIKAYVET